MRRVLFAGLLAASVAACAPAKPLVDLKTTSNPNDYQRDLIECSVLADMGVQANLQQSRASLFGSFGGAAASGASAAVLGPTTGTIGGDMTAGFIGGFIGAQIAAPLRTEREKSWMVGRCLENRGHRLLNARDVWLTPERHCTMLILEDAMGGSDYRPCVAAEKERQRRIYGDSAVE
ncbi:exported protein of unknown function [Magnetospirillum sp. XM-1]|uniref:hypothetical protein n=1 Tax=Magnetospirillum sp. XM-1 TaxID=1663591 RepID=UPI00073E079F|nr:hypothetical protein [Magnetospirillum sp. XM-1]CUW39660.1 exported protein of unknown function [Magnetospirillum sp. XM-1]